VSVHSFRSLRRLIHPKWTVPYPWHYLTINSSISECDHECETRHVEPEIRSDGSSQIRRNSRIDGYGSGFGPPRVSGSGFGTGLEPNRPVFGVQIRSAGWLPGHVAYTTSDGGLYIWPNFVQLLPFKCIQVETWTQSKNILCQNEASYRDGDCRVCN
jgi:hypothetical protein